MHPVTGRMALTTQAHVTMQGSTGLFYWRMDKFTGLHGWQSLRIIRAHALHGANSWSAEKTRTVMWLEYASTIGYILEPVL